MASPTKLATLQTALNQTRTPLAAVPDASPAIPAPSETAARTRQANRQGKVNLAAWLHPDFKQSVRLVQARRPGSIQDLMEEALNDLFAKYDVPQVVTKGGGED